MLTRKDLLAAMPMVVKFGLPITIEPDLLPPGSYQDIVYEASPEELQAYDLGELRELAMEVAIQQMEARELSAAYTFTERLGFSAHSGRWSYSVSILAR